MSVVRHTITPVARRQHKTGSGRRLRAKCTETHLNYLIGRLSRFLFLGGRHVGVCDPALTNMPAVRQIGQAMSVPRPERLFIKFRQTRQTKGAPWEQLLNLNTAGGTRCDDFSKKVRSNLATIAIEMYNTICVMDLCLVCHFKSWFA